MRYTARNILIVLVVLVVLTVTQSIMAVGNFVTSPNFIEVSLKPNNTVTKTVTLIGTASYFQKFKIDEEVDWIDVSPTEGYVDSNDTQKLTVNIDSNGKEVGTYTETIEISEVLAGVVSDAVGKFTVRLNVIDDEYELKTLPRSLELVPGQVMQVIVINPYNVKTSFSLNPRDPWIYTYPNTVYLQPKKKGIFYVRASSIASIGGVWHSIIDINGRDEMGGEIISHEFPVSVKVSSGALFNPSELYEPGFIVVKNMLERTIFVEGQPTPTVEFDIKRQKLVPGDSKTFTVYWDEKPESVDFKVLGGTVPCHRIRVK